MAQDWQAPPNYKPCQGLTVFTFFLSPLFVYFFCLSMRWWPYPICNYSARFSVALTPSKTIVKKCASPALFASVQASKTQRTLASDPLKKTANKKKLGVKTSGGVVYPSPWGLERL